MITLTLHWWYLLIVLVLAPFVYMALRKPGGDWDMQLDSMLVTACCWMAAIGLVIGRLLR